MGENRVTYHVIILYVHISNASNELAEASVAVIYSEYMCVCLVVSFFVRLFDPRKFKESSVKFQ